VDQVEVAIIGAGPHGLAAAAQLRRAGVETRVLGDPMSFWRTMPMGMVLRSNWTASCIAERQGPLSLDSYRATGGITQVLPIPLESFIDYAMWVQQQVAPDLDTRLVDRLEHRSGEHFGLTLEDGEGLSAHRVVVATGIAPFAFRPSLLQGLPTELASHTADHRDLSRFKGQRVAVIGGGQSALESAALLHESGATVEVLVRADHVNWLQGASKSTQVRKFSPLLYAPTDVGPAGISRLVAAPNVFRRVPRRLQPPIAARAIRPAGAAWLKKRLQDVPIHVSSTVRHARPTGEGLTIELDGGRSKTVDHLLFGTGYRIDISKYPFLDPDLVLQVDQARGYPILKPGLESSVSRLHFLGAPAAHSYGPIMRFVAGSWFSSGALARSIRTSFRDRSGEEARTAA
jgi:FAD-dependent urate hydroxylase